MKKITSVFILIVSFLISNKLSAQIQRGNILVGGDIAGFNLDLNSGGAFQATIDPKIAFFLKIMWLWVLISILAYQQLKVLELTPIMEWAL